MRTLSISTRTLMLAVAAMMISAAAFAQNWNGRNYYTTDAKVFHDVIVNSITSEPDFQKMSADEQKSLTELLDITTVRGIITFKGKDKYLLRIYMKLKTKAAQAKKLSKEEIEEVNEMLHKLSNGMKETGTYVIDGDKLTLKGQHGGTEKAHILDKGKQLKFTGEMKNVVFAYKKK